MDTTKDEKFLKIDNLKWLPFIGNDYFSKDSNNRLLAVGESHYHLSTKESFKKSNSIDFTREIIQKVAICKNSNKTRTFINFQKSLLGDKQIDTKNFWNSVAFFNLVQRPLETYKGENRKTERPKKEDFLLGWKTLFKIINIIMPDTCIFIGVTASIFLKKSLIGTDFSAEIFRHDIINGTYPRSGVLLDTDHHKTNLIFIKHTSQRFTPSEWNEFLERKLIYGKSAQNYINTK